MVIAAGIGEGGAELCIAQCADQGDQAAEHPDQQKHLPASGMRSDQGGRPKNTGTNHDADNEHNRIGYSKYRFGLSPIVRFRRGQIQAILLTGRSVSRNRTIIFFHIIDLQVYTKAMLQDSTCFVPTNSFYCKILIDIQLSAESKLKN